MTPGKSQTVQFLQAWNQGDRKGLDSLLAHHLPWIQAHVRKRLGSLLRNRGETVDFVQDAMIQFLQYGPRIQITDDNHFRALMMRIVENTIRDKHDWFTAKRRALSRENPLPRDTILCLDPPRARVRTPSMEAHESEQEAWIRLGMELMDPEDREVLILRQWEDLPFAEIGERLGLSEDAARMRNNRAVSKLGKIVGNLRRGKIAGLVEGRST